MRKPVHSVHKHHQDHLCKLEFSIPILPDERQTCLQVSGAPGHNFPCRSLIVCACLFVQIKPIPVTNCPPKIISRNCNLCLNQLSLPNRPPNALLVRSQVLLLLVSLTVGAFSDQDYRPRNTSRSERRRLSQISRKRAMRAQRREATAAPRAPVLPRRSLNRALLLGPLLMCAVRIFSSSVCISKTMPLIDLFGVDFITC